MIDIDAADTRYRTLLHYAATCGMTDAIKCFHEAGLDMNDPANNAAPTHPDSVRHCVWAFGSCAKSFGSACKLEWGAAFIGEVGAVQVGYYWFF